MKLIPIAALCLLAAGCATKRYPIVTDLSAEQSELMTCRELKLEQSEITEARLQIADTAKTDWKSVAGFLGDYGIGNSMAKNEADRALVIREASIQDAMRVKGC